MGDLDPISTVRPIHPNEPRPPRHKPRRETETEEPPEEPVPEGGSQESDHQVDDYA